MIKVSPITFQPRQGKENFKLMTLQFTQLHGNTDTETTLWRWKSSLRGEQWHSLIKQFCLFQPPSSCLSQNHELRAIIKDLCAAQKIALSVTWTKKKKMKKKCK